MPGEREPLSCYDTEDEFEDALVEKYPVGPDVLGLERFGCCFPERCCMPGPHAPSECVSVEMMEVLFAEAELETAGEEGYRS